MHIGKVLARLNPRSPQIGGAGGGRPELESTDIAGALAFVPHGLGRELLCRIWWPDGAALAAAGLDQLVMEAQVGEWKARMDCMVVAQIATFTANTHVARSRAAAQLEAAKARLWPMPGPESRYPYIRKAVLFEISAASLCARCQGHGVEMDSSRAIACRACLGHGLVRISDRGRAELIERDESTYRKLWKPVYEWTLQACQDAYGPALRCYRRALGYHPDE